MKGHNHSKSERRLKDCDFDKVECELLNVTRYFLLSYSQPKSMGWEAAFDLCGRLFGELEGPRVGMKIVNLLRTMRACRKSTFHFKNPLCAECSSRISSCERHLFAAICATRSGQIADARAEILILCEGFDPELVEEAIGVLIATLPAHLRTRGGKPLASNTRHSTSTSL